MLAELDAAGRGNEFRSLTEAFLYPLAEMLGEPGRPSWYLRFCIHAAYVEGPRPDRPQRPALDPGCGHDPSATRAKPGGCGRP